MTVGVLAGIRMRSYLKILATVFICCFTSVAHANITPQQYSETFSMSRAKIQSLLSDLRNQRQQTPDQQVAFITQALANIPYLYSGAEGEGDWMPNASVYQSGYTHIRQDPVYRLDGMDCQTFVQVTIALLHSANINQFDKNILKISYGAAGDTSDGVVHYYNRNNFVDGDWNPVNEKNGFLNDVTSNSPYAAQTSANITRQNWFFTQQKNLAANVHVLSAADIPAMEHRFMTTYSALNFPHFKTEKVTISYFPKNKIAQPQPDGSYQENAGLLAKIPTPAVVEIIRDARKWHEHGKNIRDAIGTELNISHLGLLYRQNFHKHEIIYQKITCLSHHQNNCQVTPVTCEKDTCPELMFAHATDAHPDGYYFYKLANGNYTCASTPPENQATYTRCNRVAALPLFEYLTDYQYGDYRYMTSPSILGVHIEKIN
jgi:hypothetical protein